MEIGLIGISYQRFDYISQFSYNKGIHTHFNLNYKGKEDEEERARYK